MEIQYHYRYYDTHKIWYVDVDMDQLPTMWFAKSGKPYISFWDTKGAKWNLTTDKAPNYKVAKAYAKILEPFDDRDKFAKVDLPTYMNQLFCDREKRDTTLVIKNEI